MKTSILTNIKLLRLKHNLTQQEIADSLNMSQNAYSQMEAGKTKIDIERIERIVEYYNISFLDILPPPENKIIDESVKITIICVISLLFRLPAHKWISPDIISIRK